ncbi:hypothetical protein KPL70_003536 [Citrus sinensis]|nr:hypothetical protein KPL70_003536 [Citrus sinensis]
MGGQRRPPIGDDRRRSGYATGIGVCKRDKRPVEPSAVPLEPVAEMDNVMYKADEIQSNCDCHQLAAPRVLLSDGGANLSEDAESPRGGTHLGVYGRPKNKSVRALLRLKADNILPGLGWVMTGRIKFGSNWVSSVGEDIPKPSREWNELEKRKATLNSKAMNALFCALDKKEFHRVSSCESANEIWHKLEVVYEGTNQVKESKISRTAIEEAKDLNILLIDDLVGSLISYEEDLAAEKGNEENKKSIAFKASKYKSDEESELDEEEMDMLARKFRKFFKKSNERRKFRDLKNRKEKNEVIKCYECKKPGHIRSECLFLNKLKKKAMVATWDDSEEETSDDEEHQEMKNLALMAIGDESDDELDENRSADYEIRKTGFSLMLAGHSRIAGYEIRQTGFALLTCCLQPVNMLGISG